MIFLRANTRPLSILQARARNPTDGSRHIMSDARQPPRLPSRSSCALKIVRYPQYLRAQEPTGVAARHLNCAKPTRSRARRLLRAQQ